METKGEQKKILVPVDGSDKSLATIQYLARTEYVKTMQVVLFHVFHNIPESYWDLAKNPSITASAAPIAAWQHQNRANMEAFMEKCTDLLVKSGFHGDRVRPVIHNREEGIARDILKEARNNYYAAVIRRRGFSSIPGVLVGSVTDKLMAALNFIPLVIVGKEVLAEKILISVDSSASAMKAVEFVADFAGKTGCAVSLLHIIRPQAAGADQGPLEEFLLNSRDTIGKVFEKAVSCLEQGGFERDRIDHSIVTQVSSRAGAIAEHADKGLYSMIVLGRRGLSEPGEFFIGRVPRKVVYAAAGKTVCIV